MAPSLPKRREVSVAGCSIDSFSAHCADRLAPPWRGVNGHALRIPVILVPIASLQLFEEGGGIDVKTVLTTPVRHWQ